MTPQDIKQELTHLSKLKEKNPYNQKLKETLDEIAYKLVMELWKIKNKKRRESF